MVKQNKIFNKDELFLEFRTMVLLSVQYLGFVFHASAEEKEKRAEKHEKKSLKSRIQTFIFAF